MPKKILLADDSVTIQKVVSLILVSDEYELTSVGDGDTAIAKINEIKPDLIMVDAAMPGKNGYEVSEYVKNTPALKHIPVLLLTGTFEPINEEKAKRSGIDDNIVKPFESQELVDKVANLISMSKKAAHEIPAEPFMPKEDVTAPQPVESFDMSGDFFGIEEASPSAPEKGIEAPSTHDFKLGSEGFLGKEFEEKPEKPFDISADEIPLKEEQSFEIGMELGEEIKQEETIVMEKKVESVIEEIEEIKPIEVIEPLEEIAAEAVPEIKPVQQPPSAIPEREVSIPEVKIPSPERIEEKAKEIVAKELTQFEALPKEKIEDIVAKISQKVIEEVAWEVVPDLAERIIKQEMEKIKESIIKAIK